MLLADLDFDLRGWPRAAGVLAWRGWRPSAVSSPATPDPTAIWTFW